MAKKPTAADAQLILQLYDLRREAEMRKARSWFGMTFWPESADDIVKTLRGGGPENAWFRQVVGYWEMAASLVLRGALNEDLFFDSGSELWFILGKVYPYLKESREKLHTPDAFRFAEKLATRDKRGRERLDRIMAFQKELRKSMAGAAKA